MRIAYVTADPNVPVFGCKGASVHVRQLAAAFQAVGHNVAVVAAKRGEISSSLQVPIVEIDGVASQISAGSDRVAKERACIQLADEAEQALIALHRNRRLDLIYERYSLWSAAGLRAARRIGVPFFLEVNAPLLIEQGRYRELCLRPEAEKIEAEVFGGADGIFAVSREVMRYAIERGAHADRCVVVPNGVDHRRFRSDLAAQPLPEADGKFVVGFSGSLKAWHGIESLMESFRALHEDDPRCHLLVIGEGPLRPWVEGFASGARLQGNVTVTGWVDHERVPALLQRIDVAVAPYPALADFYFSPLKLYEYMAVGKPIVASRIGQIAEIIEHGTTGLLAAPGDPSDLAEKISQLRRDKVLAGRLGGLAARHARAFTWEGNARRVIEFAAKLGVAREVA